MGELDILNREIFVRNLVNLIENISGNRKNVSFAINGAWGCGKSFVLNMLEEQLSQYQLAETASDKYFIIRYNCWKYDYYEEPLIAIVAAMIDIINQKTQLLPDETTQARVLGVLKTIGASLLTMANNSIKEKVGIDIQENLKTVSENINTEAEKIQNSHQYDIYFSFNKTLQLLQAVLRKICCEKTVIFMVDELDRCLPEYAIKVLERMHHLTENSDNVITILSMDKEQLQTSVKQIFGFDNPQKYLEKFIQFEIKLDYGLVSEQVTEKYSDYIAMFDKALFEFDESIEEFIQAIFKDIDIRMQEQIVYKATIAHQMLFPDKKDYVFMCMELLLTVLICVYNDNSCFTDTPVRFDQTDNRFAKIFVTSASKPEPAFVKFFKDKYDNISFKTEHSFPGDPVKYILPQSDKLYCSVIFLWYWLHKRSPQVIFHHYTGDEYTPIANHHIELKNFAEMIRMIK